MNKYTVQFSKDAKDDLTDIYSYIKYNLQEPNIANKLIQKIKQEIHKLKDYPIIYPIISDDFIKTLQLRKFKIKVLTTLSANSLYIFSTSTSLFVFSLYIRLAHV